jgi:ubiquinone biosynthesis monooxygenase Coq7
MARNLSRTDRFIAVLDRGLRAVAASPPPNRPGPAPAADQPELTAAESAESVRLLRVNRAGEIAAQALYSAQAVFARDEATARHLERAAIEEADHLAWCTDRLRELGGRGSYLDPVWYLAATAVGTVAGFAGDGASLGFVAETERQVEAHLDDNIERLPRADHQSRAILEQMRADEARHGSAAVAAGGAMIREPVRTFMALGGGTLRRLAYRL